MPITFLGYVWDDEDEDGVREFPSESGLEGRTITATKSGGGTWSGDSMPGGAYLFQAFGGAGDYILECSLPSGWTATTPHSIALTLGADDVVETDFGQTDNPAPARQCVTVLSSWVEKVCWVPGRGVQVTFRHSVKGLFTCFYPGTTFADYTRFKAAPSKGRHVAAFYADRPFVEVAPDS